jgi:hypothetical protein
MRSARRKAVAATLSVILTAQFAAPAFAHNERIHQGMTDYAYHLALAMRDVSVGDHTSNILVAELAAALSDDSGMASFYSAARRAVPKLRRLRSGLPDDPAPCIDPEVLALVDDDADLMPDWQLVLPFDDTLAVQKMGNVVYPITTGYFHKNIHCEIDKAYKPIGSTTFVNPTSGTTAKDKFRSRDHTGVTLGYWAGGPDRALKDWIFRSTTLETLQSPPVEVSVGVGVSALAMAACAIACGMMPILCAICPAVAIGAGILVIDAINDLDASSMEHDDFTGLGHHIDMKPLTPGDSTFDDQRGKNMEKAGPAGAPDMMDDLITALYDLLGWHVRHDLSQGPANYQIAVAGTPDADGHPDSVPRSAAVWETATGAHIDYTPVDNLAMWGWTQFKQKQPDADPGIAADAAPRLGWSLHALGDATVPMHTVGATGFGHRPYEDSFDNRWEELVFADGSKAGAMAMSARQARQIVRRALVWRQFILNWRASNGGTKDVPIRDLVTALAAQTRTDAAGVAGVYNSAASLQHFFLSEADANAQYSSPTLVGFQRGKAIEAVAAHLAFLISAMEAVQ